MSTKFNPDDWLPKPANSDQYSAGSAPNPSTNQSFNPSEGVPSPPRSITPSSSEVDTVIARIEAELTDIAPTYADWLNLGFAFAHEFGEAGRTFYHRVSRFYNGYTRAETDKQYDQCLKSQGHGITIRTFFHMAKEAGVEVGRHGAGGEEQGGKGMGQGAGGREEKAGSREQGAGGRGKSMEQDLCTEPQAPCSSPHALEDDPPAEEEQMPTLPDEIFDRLPDFFKRVVSRADSKEERDMLLLGSMVTLGSCLTTFSGIYDGNQVYPTLFLYIAARASSGKGRLVMCRNLVNPVHWEKRKQSQQENQVYEVELREYNALKGKDVSMEKPAKPPVRMHIIPANNTTAGLLQLLADNDGEGLIIETEGDTIAKTLKKEMSDFSDFMRKVFHHEMISGYRKTDHEHSEVEKSRFNMILSSTMGQLIELIPSAENGLLSRFLFYYMNLRPVWKDVFAHSNNKSLNQHFSELGFEFYNFYKTLRAKDPIEFGLTEEQQRAFNDFFARMQDKYLALVDKDYMAIVRRLGLIAFRLMMILTAMRIPETGDYSARQQCGDEDFETALSIVRILVRHASYIVSQLPAEVKTEKRGNKKERFFEGLPQKFNRRDFLALAKSFSIADRTADKYIDQFCTKGLIFREQTNEYVKIAGQ